MSATSVQFVPFQDSTTPVCGGANPPIAKDDVDVPAHVKYLLPVFIAFTSVQLVPLKVSVLL